MKLQKLLQLVALTAVAFLFAGCHKGLQKTTPLPGWAMKPGGEDKAEPLNTKPVVSQDGLVPMGVGAAATAFAGLGMALVQFLLGVDAPVSWLLLQQILVTVLVNTLIALPVYSFVRWVLRPVLPEDPRRRRRRAYATGGLSPLEATAARARPRGRVLTR